MLIKKNICYQNLYIIDTSMSLNIEQKVSGQNQNFNY